MGDFHAVRQRRSAVEVVDGQHNFRGDGVVAHGLLREFSKGFHLDVAPGATGGAGFHQPEKFVGNATGEASATFGATASGDQGGGGKFSGTQP
jgi:hypothetical protein